MKVSLLHLMFNKPMLSQNLEKKTTSTINYITKTNLLVNEKEKYKLMSVNKL